MQSTVLLWVPSDRPSAPELCRDWCLNKYFQECQGEVYAFQMVGWARSNSSSCIWSQKLEDLFKV